MKILNIITGSIAAVKSPEIVRLFTKNNDEITCILTKSAEKFVTPLSLSYLSGRKAYSQMFEPEQEAKMAHINLSREHDVILVAPASADFIAKLANGFCDDLASTVCIASDKKLIIAPAMNPQMMSHPATQRNIEQLKKDGAIFIDSEAGEMACGEEGFGRMAEPESIFKFIQNIDN